jgi:hypothetical protein
LRGLPARSVEYHSLDQPLWLRVISPAGWESYFENAILFWPDRACGDDRLRNTAASGQLRKRLLTGKGEIRGKHRKDYWLTSDKFLCPRPTSNVIDCQSIPSGSKLRPDGIERGITSDAFYHVKLEDGRTGYISAFALE